MLEALITGIVILAAIMARMAFATSSLLELRTVDIVLLGMAISSQSRAVEFALTVVLLFCLANDLLLELRTVTTYILNKKVFTMPELHKRIRTFLRVHLSALLEELVSASNSQLYSKVFPMVGSFPTAPGVLTVVLYGGGTISAATSESDFESVRTDLIVEYQCVRDRQIEICYSRPEREAAQRRLDEARRIAQSSFEEHAIAQRNWANPHLQHCPLTWKLRAVCACYTPAPSPPSESCRTCTTARKPSGFRYGRDTHTDGIHAPAVRTIAADDQARAPSATTATKQSVVYTVEESEAALAKLRAGLGMPDPRTSPQVAREPFTYGWTIWHWPEVREWAIRNAHAQAQVQAPSQPQAQWQWQSNQSPPPPQEQQGHATGHQQDHPPAPPSTNAPSPAAWTWAENITPSTAANTTFSGAPTQLVSNPQTSSSNGIVQSTKAPSNASSAAPTQPISNSNTSKPNGVMHFTMATGNTSSAANATQSGNPPMTTMGASGTASSSLNGFAPPQGPATTTAATAVTNPSGPTAFQDPAPAAAPSTTMTLSAPGLSKTDRDKKLKKMMLEVFRPWREFRSTAPDATIKALTVLQACEDLVRYLPAIHQYTVVGGQWQTSRIGKDLACKYGFKGIEWERIKTEFGAYVRAMVNSPDYPKLQAAWVAFDNLDRAIPDSVVGMTYPMSEA